MSKRIHVVIFPSGGDGCGCYRMIWPGEAVRQAGLGNPVNVMQRSPQIAVDTRYTPHRVTGISTGSATVVVFQRPGSYQMQQVIPILQAKGVKVVIDMDDDLSKIHPRNPAHKVYDPKLSPDRNWKHCEAACALADWVTVTTPKLAERYGRDGRVTVIPNHVPRSYLRIKRVDAGNELPTVGWAGYTGTHPNDLQQTRGAVNQALTDTKAKFIGFGDSKIFNNLQIRQRSPHELLGFTNINDYPLTLAKLDIGLVPLEHSPFNDAKSWLKALEYCALGVVPVVTPTSDNQRLIDLGAAIPASTPGQWHLRVKELILDGAMRRELSDHCRKIASAFTIEGNTDLWWDTWAKVNNL